MNAPSSHHILGLALGLSLANLASAQSELFQVTGDKPADRFGIATAPAGDFNGDGYADIVIGAPEDASIFSSGEGFARVHSGLNGAVLFTAEGIANYECYGAALAGGLDLNGDGVSDFLVGAPKSSLFAQRAGRVEARSGVSGALIFSINGLNEGEEFGSSIAAIGDVNFDGRDDFAVGAPKAPAGLINEVGRVTIHSGLNGTIIHSISGSGSSDRFGYDVAWAGDLTGDGRDDVIAGSLFGGVKVISGASGAVVNTIGANSSDVYGRSVASISDLNGDGVRDLVIGATEEDFFSPGIGYVDVVSGTSGFSLFTVTGQSVGDRFGWDVAVLGDWDGDGTEDFAVSAVPNGSSVNSYVRVISGATQQILFELPGSVASDNYGASLTALGDTTGDGRIELAIGAPNADQNGSSSGYVQVYSSGVVACGAVQNYCQTSPNSFGTGALILHSGSVNVSDNNLVLLSVFCPFNQFGVFYFGNNQLSAPFGNGVRCVGGGIRRLPVVNTGATGSAASVVDLQNPIYGISGGVTKRFQFWYRDTPAGGAGFNLSDALSIQFCP